MWDNFVESFILLGQIPGTSIHITFSGWLVMALCLSIVGAYLYDRSHEQRLMMSLIYFTIRYRRNKQLEYFEQVAL